MRKFIFSLLFASLSFATIAQQEVKVCGLHEAMERMFHNNPEAREEARQAEEILEAQTRMKDVDPDYIFTVPVVFHIIHNNGPENISDEQVPSDMETVNTNFRLLNEDLEDVVPEFIDIAADIKIEFKLAQKDEWGNCTNGITRHISSLTYEGDEAMKQLVQWDRSKYLNVWVCAYAMGAAGYSLYPSSVNNANQAWRDGIVLRHDYVGVIGTSTPSHEDTFSHEIGHWLNLRHTWGNSNEPGLSDNCEMDDLCDDTPMTEGWTTCALSGISCGALSNVQNYMEYSGCRKMFTNDQSTRMRCALSSPIADREELWTEENLEATGVSGPSNLCIADFSAVKKQVCLGEMVNFDDDSYNEPSGWSWDFGDGNTLEGNDPEIHKNPSHGYTEPGVYTVTLTVDNGVDELVKVKESFITVMAPGELESPLVEGFEDGFPENEWWLNNPDEGNAWEITSTAAYSGSNSLKLQNYSNQVQFDIDEIVSSTFDFSQETEVYVEYKWSYANKLNETSDKIRLYISADCGDTWILKEQHSGTIDLATAPATNSQFVPSGPSDWGSDIVVIDNPGQLSENFRAKFTFVASGGNNVYLDDINIYGGSQVSVDDQDGVSTINIYPNPASDNLTLETLGIQGNVVVTFHDLTGRQVKVERFVGQSAYQQVEMNTGMLSEGTYLVTVSNGTKRITEKVVIRR